MNQQPHSPETSGKFNPTKADLPYGKLVRHYNYLREANKAKSGERLPLEKPDFYEYCDYLRKAIVYGYVDDDTLRDYGNTVESCLKNHRSDKSEINEKKNSDDDPVRSEVDRKIILLEGFYSLFFGAEAKLITWKRLSFYGLKHALLFLFKFQMRATESLAFREMNARLNEAFHGQWKDCFLRTKKYELNSEKPEWIPNHKPDLHIDVVRGALLCLRFSMTKDVIEKLTWLRDAYKNLIKLGSAGKIDYNKEKSETILKEIDELLSSVKEINNVSEKRLPEGQDSPALRLFRYLSNAAQRMFSTIPKSTPTIINKEYETRINNALNTFIGVLYSLGVYADKMYGEAVSKHKEWFVRSNYWYILSRLFMLYSYKIKYFRVKESSNISDKKEINNRVKEKSAEYRATLITIIESLGPKRLGEVSVGFNNEECDWKRLSEIAKAMSSLGWMGDLYREKEIQFKKDIVKYLDTELKEEISRSLKAAAEEYKKRTTGTKFSIVTILDNITQFDDKDWNYLRNPDFWSKPFTDIKGENGKACREAVMKIFATVPDKVIPVLEECRVPESLETIELLSSWVFDTDFTGMEPYLKARLCFMLADWSKDIETKVRLANKVNPEEIDTDDGERLLRIAQWIENKKNWEEEKTKLNFREGRKVTLEEVRKRHFPLATADFFAIFRDNAVKYLTHDIEPRPKVPGADGAVLTQFSDILKVIRDRVNSKIERLQSHGTPISELVKEQMDAYVNGVGEWMAYDENQELKRYTENLTSPSWVSEIEENRSPFNLSDRSPFNGLPRAFQRSIKITGNGLNGIVSRCAERFQNQVEIEMDDFDGTDEFSSLSRISVDLVENFIKQSISKNGSVGSVPKLKFFFPVMMDAVVTENGTTYTKLSMIMTNTSVRSCSYNGIFEKVRRSLGGDTGTKVRELAGLADFAVVHKNEQNRIALHNYLSYDNSRPDCEYFSEEEFAVWMKENFDLEAPYSGYTEIVSFYVNE